MPCLLSFCSMFVVSGLPLVIFGKWGDVSKKGTRFG